jgi:septal ring factor EnvC (AmiA/AmiB activator)
MILSLIKKIPWWGYVALGVAILFSWQFISGWAASRKLYDMALNQLREDRTQIIEEKEAYIKDCEDEISKLAGEKEALRKEKLIIQRQASESAAEVARLEGNIHALERQLQSITIGDNPDYLLDDLRKRGLSTIRRHR